MPLGMAEKTSVLYRVELSEKQKTRLKLSGIVFSEAIFLSFQKGLLNLLFAGSRQRIHTFLSQFEIGGNLAVTTGVPGDINVDKRADYVLSQKSGMLSVTKAGKLAGEVDLMFSTNKTMTTFYRLISSLALRDQVELVLLTFSD
jgi:hypothetical protein